MQIGELEKEVKKYEGFNRYITKAKELWDKFMRMRWGIALSTTAFLVICILVFDIKVSQIVQKIPLLSSIIDTKLLEEFEAINEQDEFYQAMMSDSWSPSVASSNTNISDNTGENVVTVPVSEVENDPPEETIPKDTRKAIQNILPERAKIENILVQKVSPTEKLFKIILDNGMVRYVQVKKESEKYMIEGR